MALRTIGTLRPTPVDGGALVERLRLTAVSAGYAVLAVPALALGVLTLLAIALAPVAAGFAIALVVVPASAALAAAHRRVTGDLLGEPVIASYAGTAGTAVLGRPARWLRDPARWRDLGLLWFSATGGLAMSLVPVALLAAAVAHLADAALEGGGRWWSPLWDGPLLVGWWCVTPALVRGRAVAERTLLGGSRAAPGPAESRSVGSDPAAVATLREDRETTDPAPADLPSAVRGRRPRALAEHGLAGGVEALALSMPLPVTVAVDLPRGIPERVEAGAYHAVAECLADVVGHPGATRAWVVGSYDDGVLHLEVGGDGGDDGGDGGAPAAVARWLAALGGTAEVAGAPGGPRIVTLRVPCRTG